MKKIIFTMLVALFMITVVSCKSVSPKRKACDNGCVSNKNTCYNRAKDKKGHIDAKKKNKCDVDFKACFNDCARKFK